MMCGSVRCMAVGFVVIVTARISFAGNAAKQKGTWWTPAEATRLGQVAEVLGPGAGAAWEVIGGAPEKDGGPFTIEKDPILGRPVIVCGSRPVTLQGRTAYQDVEILCLVRLASTAERPQATIDLAAAKDPADPKDKGLRVYIVGSYDKGLSVSALDIRQNYVLRAYDKIMPTWDDSIRIPIEKDMSSLALSQDKWVRIRYRLAKDSVRVWIDDRLIVDKKESNLKTSGTLRATLSPGTRLAEISVRRPTAVKSGYETIALDGYVRDRSLVGSAGVANEALPFGQTVEIDGIPFRFADRSGKGDSDHIDVGRSLLRQGSMQGYFPSGTQRLVGSFTVDPARIQLRVPNGRYDAMYVIAAFDGERPSVPVLTVSFYRPAAGFPHVFETTVPSLRERTCEWARPLPVALENGKRASLWLVKIPLDPDKLSSFSDMDIVEVELSKQVRQYRSYPDPYIYGWHGAGLPSGVHVYAITLRRRDIHMSVEPAVFGHVWTDPAKPAYVVTLENRTAKNRTVSVKLETKSHDRTETLKQEKKIPVPAGKEVKQTFTFAVKKNGYHEIVVTMRDRDRTWVEKRSFARLAKDTRAPFWEEGKGPLFGFWSYAGGHYTPPWLEVMTVMKAAGARGVPHAPHKTHPAQAEKRKLFDEWKWRGGGNAWPIKPQWSWAAEEKVDPKKYEAYKKTAIEAIRKHYGEDNPEFVTFFPEPHISRDLTCGSPPEYWGEPEYRMNDAEKRNLRVFMNTSKAAAEAVRKEWPNTKILIPWGDPLFIIPFLRSGFPKHLIDGSALDMIGFERLPEQQIHQMSTHRLYILKEEYKKYGMEDPFLPYNEGVFVPTEPGACTWDEQAELYHRWTLISLAYGIERFYSGWFAYDCGDYYGAEHYGGCGIQRRIPYCDPKPAYVHYATMTRMLDRAKFEKWLPTGSHTAYCLKFSMPGGGPVYVLWTVRGKRALALTLEKDTSITVTDSMDNGTVIKSAGGVVEFTITTSPVYIIGAGKVKKIALGKPDHSDAVGWSRNRNQQTWDAGPARREPPVTKEVHLADLGDGTWSLVAEQDEIYENNNYDTKRYLGRMSAKVVEDPERKGSFLGIHLEKQDKERKLMPWYSVLRPRKPVTIPGKAVALGLWLKANSDWGRVVYCLKDAKGERWISIGTKDQWNCNDVHGWSMFNFDGWRYVRFELPAHSEYDSFREYGTTWWGSYGPRKERGRGDGIVDLPVRLEKIIVERRTHVIYVNDIQPANPADVLLGELVAEYETEFHVTDQAVALNRVRMKLPKGDFKLTNPIEQMAKANELSPVKLAKVTMPEWGYDGTRCHVHFTEVPNAAEYQVWVAAYPDGRGAVALGMMNESGGLVSGLRPARKLYLWVTYTGEPAKRKAVPKSKPSNCLEINLVDAFGQK